MANEQLELMAEQLGVPEPPDGAMRITYAEDAPVEEQLQDLDGELHKHLIEELKQRKNFSKEYTGDRHEDWDRVREHKNMYVNLTRDARAGDRSTMFEEKEMPFERSVVIPLTKATLEVLITQIMSIYAARVPMNQIMAAAGGDPVRAKIMEAMISYDNIQSRAFSAIYAMFSDALSFGNGYMYNSWEIDEGITYEFEPLNLGGVPPQLQRAVLGPLAYTPIRKIGVQREYCKWTPISAYDALPDPRVSMWDMQSGEFMGHHWKSSPFALKKKEGERGPYFNVDKIPKRSNQDDTGDRRSSSPDPYNAASEADPKELLGSKTPSFLNMYTMVWELIPSDHMLGDSDYPEKWLFTWAEDKVIVRAHPLINKHQKFPYVCAEPEPNFFDTFSPGTLELIEPLQRFINWLYNSHIENITRVLNNQYVYSPQFIEEGDLEFGGPGEHVRMTQEAVDMMLGGEIQDIRQFLFQMPVQDVTGASYMNAIQYTYQMAQVLSGANDPLSGIQLPTQRSATEVGTITAQATQRMAITARLMDENAIEELVRQSMHNRQQFTSIGRYYEIVGRMAEDLGIDSIFADLEAIQGDFKYRPISGILPEDPSRSAMNWTNLMGAAGQLPQLQQPGPDGRMLDFRSIFNTIAEKSGISNIDDYYMDVQVMPDEQVQQQAQAGNLVPVGG
jgi:hypothetical protein